MYPAKYLRKYFIYSQLNRQCCECSNIQGSSNGMKSLHVNIYPLQFKFDREIPVMGILYVHVLCVLYTSLPSLCLYVSTISVTIVDISVPFSISY